MLNLRPTISGSAGFTLVELMICVVILGIAAALGVPMYTEWMQSTQVRNAAEAVSAGLRLARSEAVKRNVPVQFALGAGSSWTVGCVTVVAGDCPAIIQSRETADGSSSSINVNSSDAPIGTPVIFSNLGRMTSPVPGGGSTFIAINFSSTTVTSARRLRVTLDIGGSARMCDPTATAAADSRLCP